jgi:hypothetical protein
LQVIGRRGSTRINLVIACAGAVAALAGAPAAPAEQKPAAADNVPVPAIGEPLPRTPLCGPDNRAAGQIAGRTLCAFAKGNWSGEPVQGVLIGDLADPGAAVNDRVQGITDGVHQLLPALKLAALDTGGQSVRAGTLLTRFLRTETGYKMLVATLDDLTAIYAKNATSISA